MKRRICLPAVQPLVWLAAVGAVAGAVLCGCTREQGPAPPTGAVSQPPTGGISGKLTVLVPCGQLGPYMEAKQVFLDKHPGLTIEQTVENINVLRTKLLEDKLPGADVFMDMGDTVAKELIKAGKTIEGTEVEYAQNRVAVIVPVDNPAGIHKFEDLGKPSVKAIGLAEPSQNSNGRYAAEALKESGLWDALDKGGRIVRVDQPVKLKAMVSTKKVDAAFIYSACAHESAKGESAPKEGGTAEGQEMPQSLPKKVTLVGNVPEDLYTPFYCTAAVLSARQNEPAARAFVEFLASEEASEIWQKWHFGLPRSRAEESSVALLVHCGAGMRPPMDELATLFRERSGTRVDMTYKGSGCLLADIEFSRKGDLYMPGEQDYMDQAAEKGFILEQQPVAHMETVIITPLDSKHKIESLEDLAKPGLKIGLGAVPQVAVGIAAKRVLDAAGLWEAVQKNVTMNALNVVELANSVKLDGVDAAIVWNATAHLVKDDVNIIPIDAKYSYQTTIPLATLDLSRHPDQAQQFFELVTGLEGQEIFKRYGYGAISARVG